MTPIELFQDSTRQWRLLIKLDLSFEGKFPVFWALTLPDGAVSDFVKAGVKIRNKSDFDETK